MSQSIVNYLMPVLLIIVGGLLKFEKIPNSENIRKYWWVFVVLGCLNTLLNLILLFVKY